MISQVQQEEIVVALQCDGHAEVVLRRSPIEGQIVAKVPNGAEIIILQREGAHVKVQIEAWVKASNVQQLAFPPAVAQVASPAPQPCNISPALPVDAMDQSASFCRQGGRRLQVSLRGLKRIAKENGVDKEEVDNCDAHDNPAEAVLQLIFAKKATPVVNPIVPAELLKMSLRDLRRIAKVNGVDKVAAENCDAYDNPAEAVLQLILARRDWQVKTATATQHHGIQVAPECVACRFEVFCCHTKQSSRWSCEDFVRDHVWGFFEPLGVRTFYDRMALVGRPIHECLKAAAHTKVMLVVLDDTSPSRWMLDEIQVALDKNISVQTIYCKDKFSWNEVGKPAWKQKNVPAHMVRGVFENAAIPFDCDALYINYAKSLLMELVYSMLGKARV